MANQYALVYGSGSQPQINDGLHTSVVCEAGTNSAMSFSSAAPPVGIIMSAAVVQPALESGNKRAATAVAESDAKKRKVQYRWPTQADVVLLEQVSVTRPFAGAHGEVSKLWSEVHSAVKKKMGASFTPAVDGLKAHFSKLMSAWSENEAKDIRSSGTEQVANITLLLFDWLTCPSVLMTLSYYYSGR